MVILVNLRYGGYAPLLRLMPNVPCSLVAADAHKEGLIGGPLDACLCDLPPSPRTRYSLSHPCTVASTMIQKLACSAALLATIASAAHAQRTAAANCAAMQKQHLTNVKITEAVAVPPRATPTRCKSRTAASTGIIGKEIRFSRCCPTAGTASSSWAAAAASSARWRTRRRSSSTPATRRPAPTRATRAAGPRRVGAGQPGAAANFGTSRVHRTAETAKAILRSYYGASRRASYFSAARTADGRR